MSLSKLELIGFKSFMSPVTLSFKEGITAILGPNGCGKTNIVDAVRWVLGEQSARQLRGIKMENVIFNGTQVHKPMGYAVVNLTISNERGVFPLDYSEIMITRKIYRSGLSEYFINKAPCRLKDIKELFADTGTGSHSYAVIEQEMMDYVLNDAHGERRNMFEEASGIVKYRMRREEAKRKLKLTETDLIRLDDILEELGKQVRSLRYQMGKAKRYNTVKERIRLWELIHLRRNLSGLLVEKRAAESELASARDLSRKGDLSLGEMEKRVEGEKMRLIDLEKRNTELQNLRYDVRRKIQVSEEKVIQFTERRREAERRIERAGRENDEAGLRLEKIAERISVVTSECDAISRRIAMEEESIKVQDEEFREISDGIERIKAKILELKQTQFDFLQDQVRSRSSLEHYESILAELDSRSAETRDSILELERETRDLSTGTEERESELKALSDRLAASEREREGSLETVGEIERRLTQRESLLSERRTELARLKSRHDLFVKMKDDFEGFPGGARYVLKKRDGRVRGPIAELLGVEDRFRPALEAVLGGMMDGVVVESFSGAMELANELAERKTGRVRFFVEDMHVVGGTKEISGFPGLLGSLSAFVEVDEARRAMVDNLLGETYVFESTDDALRFIESDRGNGLGAVTLSGIYFCRGKGIYFSGSPGEEISLLGRSEEIDRMKESISKLHDIASKLETGCSVDRDEKEALRRRVEELKGGISKMREELSGKREELQEIEKNYIMKKEKCALLLKSLDDLENSRAEILSKLEEIRLTLQMQQQGGEASDYARCESELAALQSRRGEIEAELTGRKIEIASLQGALEKKGEEIRGQNEMKKQFQDIIEQRNDEIFSSKEESAELEKGIGRERDVVRGLLEREGSYQSDIDEFLGTLEAKRSEISEKEKDLKARQNERERIFTRQNEVKVTLSSLETRMKDLVDKGSEVFEEDMTCYLGGEEIPLTAEEGAITPEMLEREKRKLDSLGPVNLAAVEEYEEKKARLDFLLSQKEDLVSAKEELSEAIRKVNKKARKSFLETFSAVRKYFAETFQVLFDGGEADLSLGDGGDPLEAEIIITARPKGKRLQDITLLSGGERALTSLALLFAFYKVKPSTFCIFDEVDAPLDDANIQRFVRMLDKFQKETQFIIITHNKHTMEIADSLYGVTMQEKGVSSLVSVDIEGIKEVLGARKPDAETLVESSISSN